MKKTVLITIFFIASAVSYADQSTGTGYNENRAWAEEQAAASAINSARSSGGDPYSTSTSCSESSGGGAWACSATTTYNKESSNSSSGYYAPNYGAPVTPRINSNSRVPGIK